MHARDARRTAEAWRTSGADSASDRPAAPARPRRSDPRSNAVALPGIVPAAFLRRGVPSSPNRHLEALARLCIGILGRNRDRRCFRRDGFKCHRDVSPVPRRCLTRTSTRPTAPDDEWAPRFIPRPRPAPAPRRIPRATPGPTTRPAHNPSARPSACPPAPGWRIPPAPLPAGAWMPAQPPSSRPSSSRHNQPAIGNLRSRLLRAIF